MEALGDKANTVGRAKLDENLFLGTLSLLVLPHFSKDAYLRPPKRTEPGQRIK